MKDQTIRFWLEIGCKFHKNLFVSFSMYIAEMNEKMLDMHSLSLYYANL